MVAGYTMKSSGGAESLGEVCYVDCEWLCRLCWFGHCSLEVENPGLIFKQESGRIRLFLLLLLPLPPPPLLPSPPPPLFAPELGKPSDTVEDYFFPPKCFITAIFDGYYFKHKES